MKTEHARRFRFLAPVLLVLALIGCSSLYLGDCPEGGVIGVDKPRIRSWQIRTLLVDEAAAADRLADYAAMSAYAYVQPADQECGNEPKLTPEEQHRLQKWLKGSGWERVFDAEYAPSDPPSCEDDVGLFYHVWKRETGEKTEVIIAFRGTWGANDWWYGNSYWARRFFTHKHQYTAARIYAEQVIQHFHEKNIAGKILEFSSTGHSLGGGLAQAVLYDQANTLSFKQAYAFAPSSATAYTTRHDKSPFENCSCNGSYPEPRIYRIYESYEILANLRFFHKLVFPPEAWINEVRFNFADGTNPVSQHSMSRFALTLMDTKTASPVESRIKPWYASPDTGCTAEFQASQSAACGAVTCSSTTAK